jgi:hypothetical protein
MMNRPAFDESELQVIGATPCGGWQMMAENFGVPGFPKMEPLFNRPISEKENFRLWFAGEVPYWTPVAGWVMCDLLGFRPRVNTDNVANRMVFDGEPPVEYVGFEYTTEWFDLTWVFVPEALGATVKPGNPKLDDMEGWEERLAFPDLDALDFEACGRANAEYLASPKMNQLGILNGFWERLMSVMDVENAAIALIDEDQREDLHRFFDRYADLLIDYIKRVKAVAPIDGVLIHDDWGHQRSTFFSIDTAREMLVPYLRRVTDAVHDMGMSFELHSCGLNGSLVPAYVEAGVDLWCPQEINDVFELATKYKDLPITFGDVPYPVALDAPEEEHARAAEEWFERYKDLRVIPAFKASSPVFFATLYRLSRQYYCEKAARA